MSVDFAPLDAARSAARGAGQQASAVSQLVDSGQFAAALALLTGTGAAPQLAPAAASTPVLVTGSPAPASAGAPTGTAGPAASGGTGSAAGPAASGVTGAAVVTDARRYLGIPYQWGGTNPATGLDCSGLVQRVYGDLGVSLPRVSQAQAQAGTPVANLAAAQPGDLVFYEPGPTGPGHVGIYLGAGQMIDAPHTGAVVRIDPVGTPSAIRRILPGATAFTAATAAAPVPAGAATATTPASYLPMFLSAAGSSGVPPQLLSAVAQVESGFNPAAVSGAGAQGLMQLMPQTAAGLGVDPLDPAQAISGAARLLSAEHARFGSWPLAVAAYNAGGGAVSSYGGIPPYPETQAYVSQVLALAGMSP